MRQYLGAVAAITLVAICYPFARIAPATSEIDALAARFRFKRLEIPDVASDPKPEYKTVRKVHRSLERISAWVSSMGASITLADLDGDGLSNDLICVDPRTDLVTVVPAPGTGDRYAAFAFDRGAWSMGSYDPEALAPMGTIAGDFNEDGSRDVLVYFWGRTPVLYLRKSATTKLAADEFLPVELVSTGERWYTCTATQADFDGDGHLDLMLGSYFQDGAKILDSKDSTGTVTMHEGKSKASNGGKDRLFLWHSASGDSVVFRETPDALPAEIVHQWAIAVGAADLDGDLLPELYVANDFGPDHLLHNRSTPGHPKFALLVGERDIYTPKSCVLGQDSFKSMGVDFGDVNGDGILDIYVSNIAAKFALMESHFLWLSTGETGRMKDGVAPYVHGAEKLGLSRSGFGWQPRLADFDNDGVLEAVQACGFIKGKVNRWPELQALGTSNDQMVHNPRFWPSFRPGADLCGDDWNPFFVRGSDGRYHDIAQKLGLDQRVTCRGIATADVDGDGRLDFATANQWAQSSVFKNESPNPGAYLGLRLMTAKGFPAVGAVARVKMPDGRKLVAEVDGGNGHSAHRSPEIHFGLGSWDPSRKVDVEIRWRNSAGSVELTAAQFTPGWHTVRLISPAQKVASAMQ